MGSWSDLANAMSKTTPSSAAAKGAVKKNAMQSFEKFKKAAQEKEERVSTKHTRINFNCANLNFC